MGFLFTVFYFLVNYQSNKMMRKILAIAGVRHRSFRLAKRR